MGTHKLSATATQAERGVVSPAAQHLTITLTVVDTATIFTGPDTVYRYDLPGTGIQEGWATRAVIDQLRTLSPTQWPEIEVIVDASPEVTDIVVATLVAQGVVAYPIDVAAEPPGAEESEPGRRLRSMARAREGTSSHESTWEMNGRTWFAPTLIAVAVVVVLAGAWWTIRATTGSASTPHEKVVAAATTPASPTPSASVKSPQSSLTNSVASPQTQAQEHLIGQMRVETPPGFTVEERPGTWLLTGPDDTLRIHVSADPIYTVTPETVLKEAVATIEFDPELRPVDIPVGPLFEGTRVRYSEIPGDGSVVDWVTWVEHGHLMAMGCHTRHEPTIPNKAACRLAAETLSFVG
ncbi:Uncharacterized protein conserved in bacteria [Corynebacterium renale]|uniref:type VII secretion-associated protein n=1 Tax=Corynebacterium renale TaxID=1724 RepID=UPI000DA3A20A|nr:type VII secretion-associated protein [Corynebacterium renale]SQG64072.1 Uncharacterized protein conserved in bacteria [Corynebacterium renale]STC94270.1 Uncharacterized protein conserved in bacteria [Corynebacterium renale]